jgi:N-methylhydantoinase B
MVQPIEGQERLSPIRILDNTLVTDSGGPGKWRGGVGINKTSYLLEADGTVLSYICDRERSIAFGIKGGLPSNPHGLWLRRPGENQPSWLGAVFSDVPTPAGSEYSRIAGGGGGLGDPLERDPKLVAEDVMDDYVSLERARIDYGVVLKVVDKELAEYSVDWEATKAERARIRAERRRWLDEDADSVAARYRKGELSDFDLVRRYGVIVDWGTGEVLPRTTAEFRRMLKRRTAAHWQDDTPRKEAAE